MTHLEDALVEIALFLDRHKIPYMLIGGVANVFWGIPRATIDVDVTIKVDDSHMEAFVKKLASKFKPYPPEPIQFVKETRVLPVKTSNGIRADIIFGQLPYETDAIKRAVSKKVGNSGVKVCSPEDLIIHKIISERAKDKSDVEGIIKERIKSLDRSYLDPILEQLARELTQPEILDFYKECIAKSR